MEASGCSGKDRLEKAVGRGMLGAVMTIQLGDSGLDLSGAVQCLECGAGKTWSAFGWGCWWDQELVTGRGSGAVGSEAEQKLSRPPCCWSHPVSSAIQGVRRGTWSFSKDVPSSQRTQAWI